MKCPFLLSLFIALLPLLLQAQMDSIPVSSEIDRVAVYRTNARVYRTAKANVPAGTSLLVLKDISSKLLINSIQVKIKNKQVALVSALPRMNYEQVFVQNTRSIKRLRLITDSIKIITRALSETTVERNSISSVRQLMLNHNPLGSAKDAGFTVEQIRELMNFRRKELTDIDMELLNLNDRIAELNAINLRIVNERNKMQQKVNRSSGQLLLQIQASKATATDIEVSYIVGGTGWSPLYDIKSDGIGQPLTLVYKAQVYQNTGYDWKQVNLSLSSSDPTMSHDRPILSPFRIGITPQAVPNKVPLAQTQKGNTYIQYQGTGNIILEQAYKRNDPNRNTYEAISQNPTISALNGVNKKEVINSNWARGETNDTYVNGVKVIANSGNGKPMTNFDMGTSNENSTINFDLDLLQTVPSDGKSHVVTIKEASIPVDYEYHIVPKLEESAFLLAKITEHGKYQLMRGTANIFFEDVYLGQSILNPEVITDTLLLSLGRDEQITIKRERLKEEYKKTGNNMREELTFEISVRNNKNITIPITVLDQIPLSNNEQLEVNLIESSSARYYKPYGSLRWQQKLAPNKTVKLRYTYHVKYPKDHSIVRQ